MAYMAAEYKVYIVNIGCVSVLHWSDVSHSRLKCVHESVIISAAAY